MSTRLYTGLEKKGLLQSFLLVGGSLLVAICAVAIFLPARSAHAATPPDSCFNFSAGTISGYYANEGDSPANPACPRAVDIPSTIGGVAVTAIGASAFSGSQLTAVTFPNSITTIGNGAFYDNQISSVVLPSSLTAVNRDSFAQNQLTSVTIPSSVTTLGNTAFYKNQLTAVTIPSSVTSIGTGTFRYNQLTSVTVPNSVTTIGTNAFDSNQLTSVTLSNALTSIGNGVFGNNKFTSVTIPNSVTSINSAAFNFQNPDGGNADFFTNPGTYAMIWYVRLYTANPSNPNNLQDAQTLLDEQANAYDYNGDGDMDDIVTAGGHLINPASTTISYKNAAGDTLLPQQTITGLGLGTYIASDNDTNDLARYYRIGATQPFAAPAVAGYSVVTPSSPHTVTLASGENTLAFVYSNAAGSGANTGNSDLADTGMNVWTITGVAGVLVVGALTALFVWRKHRRI